MGQEDLHGHLGMLRPRQSQGIPKNENLVRRQKDLFRSSRLP